MENPEFYTTEEGGDFHKWGPHIRNVSIHALFFPNGEVFDATVGWRGKEDIEAVRLAYAKAQERLMTMDV